ncbi:NAD(P)-binding protein [Paenibacillus mendelii]|uniref:NAD(P)-binding protein n=1 Tax=Paenibacillus mendelii TaxID=206163 RepID=A0ABV6JE36_9BACL|nr:NAD(P)-binding protein [Paenibacillus mendelii]MCQ6563386.1 NAD(P)-binding protein [Paenibacillus mendelii]
MEGKFDVSVIGGGGLTGLSASILMAKAGLSVVLLEKSNKLGGLAEEAVRTGVTICHNKNVSKISHNGAIRHILFNNGDKLEIPTVLVAAGPSEACRIIPNATLERWRTQARPLYVPVWTWH